MFRSSFFLVTIVLLVSIGLFDCKIVHRRKREQQQNSSSPSSSVSSSSTRKPVSVKICGPALVRMLDTICTRARQLLMKNDIPTAKPSVSSPDKRQFNVEDDPFSHTLSFTDYSQFNNTLVGDCCLQACTLKTLLKYC